MALKKSQLYSSLWSSCDQLRGGMDASQYKDYILTLLFVKYVSDKWAGKTDALVEVPPGGSFADLVKLKGNKEIGEKIDQAIAKLAEANSGALHGVINVAVFNDETKLGKGKDMVDRLSNLIGIFEGLDFSGNQAGGDDLLGDAYEYLMRHFATESGKSKGQFYTPAEVSRIMAKVIGLRPDLKMKEPTIYDPTCGSGSLLLKAAHEGPPNIAIYGQEMDIATRALAVMNMWLHEQPSADIRNGNTLSAPEFKDPKTGALKTFDFAVANPPFSSKAWSHGLDPDHDEFERFTGYGVPPPKNGDYAFLLHLLKSLKNTGRGAIILPHGVLFRGGKEGEVRKNLLKRKYIKGIIGLPVNLFYGTGIPACIIVLDKEHAESRSAIFMIDASKGFIQDGNKNRLRERDIHKIVDVFNTAREEQGYSRNVPLSTIANGENDYSLSLTRYILSKDQGDIQDLDAHLHGGIPNQDLETLDGYWKAFPALRAALFKPGPRKGYSTPKVPSSEVKATIRKHPEFTAFFDKTNAIVESWGKAHAPALKAIKIGTQPRDIIHGLSEDLLQRFSGLPLIDPYTAFQHLMTYWQETMQDDVYLISTEGWVGAVQPRIAIQDKERKIKETPDLVVNKKKFKMDVLPPPLVAARYMPEELDALGQLEVARNQALQQLQDYIEENSGEDGALEGLKDEDGNITKGDLKERIKETTGHSDLTQDARVLSHCLKLLDAEAASSKEFSAANAALNAKVLAQYPKLSEPDVKTLVVLDKWFPAIQEAITGHVLGLGQVLGTKVKELDQRYATTLVQLEEQTASLSEKVERHLKAMGLKVE